MAEELRPNLGPFMHAVCFQYLRVGAEEYGGRALIVAAGRQRGLDLIEELGLMNTSSDAATIKAKLYTALGKDGTRLCVVEQVTAKDNGGYEVRLTEGACPAGKHSDEPLCAFTLGVFIGAISAIVGKRMTGQETECTACGAPMCIYQIDPIA